MTWAPVQYRTYAALRWMLRRLRLAGVVKALWPDGARAAANAAYRGVVQAPEEPLYVGGQRMFLASAGRYASPDMAMGVYEPGTTRLIERLLKPGDCVLDIGAHVGYYALLAARLVGSGGQVFAFEPEPENYALLVQNVALNGYRNITAVQRAVSDHAGAGQLFLSTADNGRHSLYRLEGSRGACVAVQTTTVDEFLAALGWPPVHFIKLDVEGGELAALSGMTGCLARSPRIALIVEYCPWIMQALGTVPQRLPEALLKLGLESAVVSDRGTVSLAADGIEALTRRLLQQRSYVNLLCQR